MAIFAQDDFFRASSSVPLAGTSLLVGGTWAQHTLAGSGHVRHFGEGGIAHHGGSNTLCLSYASAAPASPDYAVSATLVHDSDRNAVTNVFGVAARVTADALTYYRFVFNDDATDSFRLQKSVAGVVSDLTGSPVTAATAGVDTSVGQSFVVEIDVDGTTIRGLVNGVEVLSATDSDITGAGYAGIVSYNNQGGNSGQHTVFTYFEAESLAGPPTTRLPIPLLAGDDDMRDLYYSPDGSADRLTLEFEAWKSDGTPATGITGVTPALRINGGAASATHAVGAATSVRAGRYRVAVKRASVAPGDDVLVESFTGADYVLGGVGRVVAVDVASVAATEAEVADAVAAHADVQAIKTAATGLRTDVTTVRAGKLDQLDAAVSSRLSTAGYTAPPSAASVATAVRTNLTTELARLDAAVSSAGGLTTEQAATLEQLIAEVAQGGAETSRTSSQLVRSVTDVTGALLGSRTYTLDADGQVTSVTFTPAGA